MTCLFCEIVAGRPVAGGNAEVVWREAHGVAFLDHRPLFAGHVLLIPAEHVETLDELPAAQVGPFFHMTQKLAVAVERAMGAQGTFVAINNRVSQSVPHLHVHIVPRSKGDGLKGFFWPRHPYGSEDELRETGRLIREELLRQP